MKNPELFHKTVGILVKAYQNERLVHGDYCACAVGNLICANLGIRTYYGSESKFQWAGHSAGDWYNTKGGFDTGMGHYQIQSTGYSIDEIVKIEAAFERSRVTTDGEFDFDGYAGLMAVVDTLMLIHEAAEYEAKQAKELFTLTA